MAGSRAILEILNFVKLKAFDIFTSVPSDLWGKKIVYIILFKKNTSSIPNIKIPYIL